MPLNGVLAMLSAGEAVLKRNWMGVGPSGTSEEMECGEGQWGNWANLGTVIVMLGVVILARREIDGLEREVQGLGRLRYNLKGA